MRATGYNQMRDDEKLLAKHETLSPSFSVQLYPSHWTLNHGKQFTYNNQVSSLLEDIRAYRIPSDFLELFDAAGVHYYDGCLVVELMDFRPQKAKDPILDKPDVQRVVLRPNPETIWADICLLHQKAGATWTDADALEVESQILLRTSHPLCLDPDPHMTRVVNNIIRVSTPTVPNSLKRKAAAMVDVEEDETEKARRTKVLHFMNPKANRSSMPFHPSYRILAIKEQLPKLLEQRKQEAARPQIMIAPQLSRPQSAAPYSPANVTPVTAPAMAMARSGSGEDQSKAKSSGVPTPIQPTVQLPQPHAAAQPATLQGMPPSNISIPPHVQHAIDPNSRKSPMKQSPAPASSPSMPPPQVVPIRRPTPVNQQPIVQQQTRPQPQAPQQAVPQQPQHPAQQPQPPQQVHTGQSQVPGMPSNFQAPIPPPTFLANPPQVHKRKQSVAKPATPAMQHQALPVQATGAQPPQPVHVVPIQQVQRPGHQQLHGQVPAQGVPNISNIHMYQQQVAQVAAKLQQQVQAHQAQAQAQGQAQRQGASSPAHAQAAPVTPIRNVANVHIARQLQNGRSTPISHPGTPQLKPAGIVRSPGLTNQQVSGRSSPMISGQPVVRSSPLVPNQQAPSPRMAAPQVAAQQQHQQQQQQATMHQQQAMQQAMQGNQAMQHHQGTLKFPQQQPYMQMRMHPLAHQLSMQMAGAPPGQMMQMPQQTGMVQQQQAGVGVQDQSGGVGGVAGVAGAQLFHRPQLYNYQQYAWAMQGAQQQQQMTAAAGQQHMPVVPNGMTLQQMQALGRGQPGGMPNR